MKHPSAVARPSPLAAGGRLPCWLSALALWLAAGGVAAKVMPEGSLPALSGTHGYLAVVVDTDSYIHSLRLGRESSGRGSGVLTDIRPGRSLHMLRLPAGEYRWRRIDAAPAASVQWLVRGIPLGKLRYDIRRMRTSSTFSVEAGKINYAGDLHLRFRAGVLSLSMLNRGERALALLRDRHDHVPAQLPLNWTGEGTDPYPDWRPRAALAEGDVLAGRCPDLDQLPEGEPKAVDLFRSSEVLEMSLSPLGDLLLESAYREGRHQVNVIDPQLGDLVHLYGGSASIAEAVWLGPRRVGVHLYTPSGASSVHVFTLAEGRLHEHSVQHARVPVEGYILDPMPADPDAMLFTVVRVGHSDPRQVFRVDISRRELPVSQFQARRRLNRGGGEEVAWLGDGSGSLRVALLRDEESTILAIRRDDDGDFVPIANLGIDTMVALQAIEADGRVLLLSNQDRDQVELIRMDPNQPTAVETVFSIPGIDLADIARASDSGRVIGARYHQDGVLRTHFFDAGVQHWQERIDAAFPHRAVHLVDVDPEHGRAVVVVTDDVTPAIYYWFDADSARVEKIADASPWLKEQRFVRRQVSTVTGADGHSIQVLAAIPEGPGPHPVLVLPHGGPFYVQDTLHFDPEVQYWATRGFAVVQINFRGSYGFGVRHLVDGFAGFGRQIEDDIENALAAVLEQRSELDRERVCAVGYSYGGYSALMLALRDPDMIRCAVAVAAPTDLPLSFTSSDWSQRPSSREAMTRLVGDPSDPELQQLSPLYRAADLQVPVLLMHGMQDRRVDYEHSVRMATALKHLDKPYRLVALDKMPHAPETVGQRMCIHGVAEAFIREQLATEE